MFMQFLMEETLRGAQQATAVQENSVKTSTCYVVDSSFRPTEPAEILRVVETNATSEPCLEVAYKLSEECLRYIPISKIGNQVRIIGEFEASKMANLL